MRETMPNAAARRANKNGASSMTAATTIGDFEIQDLGEDYEFTRSGAGRKREPSPFDAQVIEWVGRTKRIPVASEEQGRELIKQLQKACDYNGGSGNGLGLTKRIEDGDENAANYVVFRVNAERASRAPRKNKTDAERLETAETE
jgi:hypothetical protein